MTFNMSWRHGSLWFTPSSSCSISVWFVWFFLWTGQMACHLEIPLTAQMFKWTVNILQGRGGILQHSPVQSLMKERRVEVVWLKATSNQQSERKEKASKVKWKECNNMPATASPFNYIKHNIKISEFTLILCYSLIHYEFNVITRMLIINMYSRKGLKCTQITFYWVYFSLLYRLLIAE